MRVIARQNGAGGTASSVRCAFRVRASNCRHIVRRRIRVVSSKSPLAPRPRAAGLELHARVRSRLNPKYD
eukprot:31113-Pelagococcus_subviridis.AAC.9